MKREDGFSLLELLVVLTLASILVSLSALAFRHYWQQRSLYGAQDLTVTQLRGLQERAVSESHPLVFGARFTVGATTFRLFRYNPQTGVCAELETYEFDAGVEVTNVDFGTPPGITPPACAPVGRSVYFYAKGTATEGALTFNQPATERQIGLEVSALTGRVTKT